MTIRVSIVIVLVSTGVAAAADQGTLRAGAYAIDITPEKLPVIVNGMFEERTADKVNDPLYARCLVLDDGRTRMAIVVVDSCMLPRDLIDQAKQIASKSTAIPADRILISATHTHSAPSAMGCLGSDADEAYVKFLPPRFAKGIEEANKRLQPARLGYAVTEAPDHTACRRWIFRPDRTRVDPFGVQSVRANMHPGYMSPDAVGPTGPADSGLSVVSVQTADGKPLAVLANFSMHYFSSPMLSADYYGLFARRIGELLGAAPDSGFVGIMSQGTSGDAWLADYSKPQRKWTIDEYADSLAKIAHEAIKKIEYRSDVPLAMAETKLKLRRRVADEKRMEWARKVVADLGGKKPKTQPEIYAREQILLHDDPERELVLQAIRIGDLGIAAIPNEVFALTGLKLKALSPLTPTFTIELANGSEGYIPPPEQHKLGGYTTWAARTAALEEQAEPKIVEATLALLEQISGKKRRTYAEPTNRYADTILASKPLAYWRLDEMAGPTAADVSGANHLATYEDGVVFHLPGHTSTSRSAHFAGARMKVALDKLAGQYTLELWFWNGLATEARPVTGYLFSRGRDADKDAAGDHLGIGGAAVAQGKLLFFNGNKSNQVIAGKAAIEPRTWNHVAMVRDGKKVTIYLNGAEDAAGEAEITLPPKLTDLFIGGRNDNFANFEGKIDEVALFDRALAPDDITRHHTAAAVSPPPPATRPAAFQRESDPKSPAESLKLLHPKPGYEIELVASEPLIQSPVAFDWSPDGRLWVVEMLDYPYGADGKMKPSGRVKILEDTDGDGKYDKSTLFLDNLNFPNGIVTFRNGVIITAAPDILYAEDTDGDGKADVKKVLYTGFNAGNPQLRVNGLRWGLDGWLYCANGWSNGVVKSIKTGQSLDIKGRDIKIHPDDGAMELLSGVSQFGLNRDDAGDWFGVDNSHPIFHYALQDSYLKRNPLVNYPDAKRQLLPANPKVYQRSPEQKRYHSFDQAAHFTSACSVIIYRDDLLFGPARDDEMHALVCEPMHTLVQHLVVKPQGMSFAVSRADDEKEIEFLASEDGWCRPVMVRPGPDGALYVADMYRYMIEHPDWLPDVGKKDFEPYYRDGDDRGRIYRVYPTGSRPRPVPRLDRMSDAELVQALDSPSGWQRDLAMMILVWRDGRGVTADLERLAASSERPTARLHALCTLDLLGALKPGVIERAFADPDASVRRHVLRLVESRAKDSPALLSAACRLVSDPVPLVRQQLAYTLGAWESAEAGQALVRLALSEPAGPHITAAVLSSATPHFSALVDGVLGSPASWRSPLFNDLLTMAVAGKRHDAVARLLKPVLEGTEPAQMQALARFLDTLRARGGSFDTYPDLAPGIQRHFDAARRVAAADAATVPDRLAAIGLLGRDPPHADGDLSIITSLLSPRIAPALQSAAVKAAGRTVDDRVPDLLTRAWLSHSPRLRAEIVDLLIGREPWALALLQQVQSGKLPRADIDPARRERLQKHASARVKELAKSLLGGETTTARQKVVEQNVDVLGLKTDFNRGAKAFAKNCATCHHVGDLGTEIGPDLASVRSWSSEALLTAILDPDKAVEPRYLSYTATLKSGEAVFGIITSESAASITLKGLDAKEQTVLRQQLKSLECSNRSLMPLGFEEGMTKQDIADVIEFVRTGGAK